MSLREGYHPTSKSAIKMSKRPNALAKAIKKPDQKPAQANNEPAAAPVKNTLASRTPAAAAAATPTPEPAAPAVALPPVSSLAGGECKSNKFYLVIE